jgi:hypothetical protein
MHGGTLQKCILVRVTVNLLADITEIGKIYAQPIYGGDLLGMTFLPCYIPA